MNTCNYDISALKSVVYFFSDDSFNNSQMHLDGSNDISYVPSCVKYKVQSVNLTETSGLNRRYNFTKQLSFSVDGIPDHIYTLVSTYHHIGFQNENGDIFMFNTELNYEYSYTISYDDKSLSTTYNIQIKDNCPLMYIENINVISEIDASCGYSSYFIKAAYTNNYDYARLNNDSITYIEGNEFAILGCLEDSISITSTTESNGKTTTTMAYHINNSEEANMLQYDMLEDNKYVVVVQFSNGKCIPIGFNSGLECNYDISQSNSDSTITIQLNELYDQGKRIRLYDFSFVQLSDFHYEYITYGSICSQNNGYAQYILKQKFDDFGNAYDDYLAYEGYEEEFPDLNITGTFDDVEEYESKECYVEPAYVKLSNSTLIFHEQYESQKIIVDANCDWRLRSLTGIIIAPNSGTTGTTEVTITNNYTVPQIGLFIIRCDYDMRTEMIGNIGVQKMPLDDVFPMGNAIECSYEAQIVNIPTNYPVTSISSDYNKGRIWYENNFINVELFENTTSTNAYTISATTKYGVYELDMTQYAQYIDWRETTQTGCDANGDLCVIEVKYVSDDDELYVPTQEERFGRVIESGYCADWEEREVVTDRSYCDSENSWKVIEVQRSSDNWTTYEVIDNILGEWLGECQATLTYSWERSTKIGKWNNRDCYLYIKTYFNQDTHVGGAVVPFTYSPDGTAGELPIIWVVDGD